MPMAGQQPPRLEQWRFAPDGYRLYRELPSGETVYTTLDSLTNGQAIQYGRQIRSSETGRIVSNLPADYGAYAYYLPPGTGQYRDGALYLQNFTSADSFNRSPLERSFYGASMDFQIDVGRDQLVDVHVPFVGLTPIGQQLYYREVAPGQYEYRTIDSGASGAEARVNAISEGYELAPAEIAAQKAMATYLMRYYWSQLTEAVNSGLLDEQGNAVERESAAAYILAKANAADIQYFVGGFVNFSKGE